MLRAATLRLGCTLGLPAAKGLQLQDDKVCAAAGITIGHVDGRTRTPKQPGRGADEGWRTLSAHLACEHVCCCCQLMVDDKAVAELVSQGPVARLEDVPHPNCPHCVNTYDPFVLSATRLN